MTVPYWSVPRLWPGETVALIASGPSLTEDQVLMLRGRVPVIVVNDSYLMAPWADIHYFADAKWYEWHRNYESPAQHLFGRERALALFHGFQGARVTIENHQAKIRAHEPGVKVVRNDNHAPDCPKPPEGLCLKPDGVRTGSNSGYQALNLAVHTGAKRLLLLGYDMRESDGRTHWFGDHPRKTSSAEQFVPAFRTLVEPLRKLGIEVVNCTPGSALDCFPKRALEETLS